MHKSNRQKLYDAILTEGARWLLLLQDQKKEIAGFGLENIQLNDATYGFLSIARVFNIYGGRFYIKTNWFKYFYLKYIKITDQI